MINLENFPFLWFHDLQKLIITKIDILKNNYRLGNFPFGACSVVTKAIALKQNQINF